MTNTNHLNDPGRLGEMAKAQVARQGPPPGPEHVATPQGTGAAGTPASLALILAAIPDARTRGYIMGADPAAPGDNIYGLAITAIATVLDDVIARLPQPGAYAPQPAAGLMTDPEAQAVSDHLKASFAGIDFSRGRLVEHVLLVMRELQVREREQRAILDAAKLELGAAYAGDTAMAIGLEPPAAQQVLVRLLEARARFVSKMDELERASGGSE